jgi:hypothetical protein
VALHQLTSFTLGVPNLAETAAYYREFGLADEGDGWLATRDGGRQLRLVPAATRRLIELRIGVDDSDGPGRTERAGTRAPGTLRTRPVTARKLGHVVIGTTDGGITQRHLRGMVSCHRIMSISMAASTWPMPSQ